MTLESPKPVPYYYYCLGLGRAAAAPLRAAPLRTAPLRSHPLRSHEDAEDDDLDDRFWNLREDQHADPDELAAVWEEKFPDSTCGVLVVDAGTRAINIPALVLEYTGDACLALVDIVEGFGARGFVHNDISKQNVLLSPRESPTGTVLIDFGCSVVRHHTDDDEIWDFTVRLFESKGIKLQVAG
ncbi:hypothetical protein GGX14DRAFT_569355 [Mycena pura]|uniref:Uncharacterized protein n=1 Tax=Mycena pura TaxID=153505 RepID=A0AAD6Y866_9AGAR|nr:hypothetical protein GGX14DRAFT_569355 [Mycena pura]